MNVIGFIAVTILAILFAKKVFGVINQKANTPARVEARKRVASARARSDAKDRAWDAEMQERMAKSEAANNRKINELLPCLRYAKAKDYTAWLAGYCKQGNEPSHFYNYALEAPAYQVGVGKVHKNWYVAENDFRIFPLYGANSVNIVVPKGINVEIEALGHCNLYFMENFVNKGHWTPTYTDTQI